MSVLYFIRHGQASFGESNYDVLSGKGHKQARILADYYGKLGISFDVVYTGTMERQKKTASEFIDQYTDFYYENFNPPINRLSAFDEHDTKSIFVSMLPHLQKEDPSIDEHIKQIRKNKKSFQVIYERAFDLWLSGNHDTPDLVPYEEFHSTVNTGIDNILKENGKGKSVAVFTSGGPIAIAVKRALNLSDKDTVKVQWQIANSSVTKFKCRGNELTLTTFNEFSHLELNGDQDLITFR
ncbi:MAG: histidine phosphatase family protein [bacterium]|nr:histidine phosphatase family protein [bacterium]